MENKTELFEKIKKELTAKELEVLTSLLMGENLKETSCSCGISVAVAANHRAKVYEKCSDLGLILTNKKTKQADLIEQLKGMLEFLTPDKPAEKEKEEPQEDASREHGNFLVLNPKKNAPNRIYKYFASAETAAKQVAKKEQETTYVLRIEKMIVPETLFYVHDFKNRIIAEDYLTQEIPF